VARSDPTCTVRLLEWFTQHRPSHIVVSLPKTLPMHSGKGNDRSARESEVGTWIELCKSCVVGRFLFSQRREGTDGRAMGGGTRSRACQCGARRGAPAGACVAVRRCVKYAQIRWGVGQPHSPVAHPRYVTRVSRSNIFRPIRRRGKVASPKA